MRTPLAAAPETRSEAEITKVVVAPRTLVTLVLLALGGVLLVALAYAARTILLQLLVAVVLAMALEPPVQALERCGLARGKAVAITFSLALIAVAAFGYLLVAPLVSEVASFAHHVPGLLQTLTQGHGSLGFLERRFHIVEHARASIADQGAGLIARRASRVVGGLLNTGAAAVTVAFLTLFVVLGGRRWFDSLVDLQTERAACGGCPIGSLVGQLVEVDEQARVALAASFERWERHLSAGLRAMQAYVKGYNEKMAFPRFYNVWLDK